MGGIPAKSIDLTYPVNHQVRGQHGPQTGQ